MSITRAHRWILGVGAVLALAALSRAPYTVSATEVAVRTRLGRPVEIVREPGLHLKLPLVDEVTRLDARLLTFDAPTAEFLTQDKKNIVVAPFVLWRIAEPLRFMQTLYTRQAAEARLADLTASEIGAALGVIPFSRLVSAAPGEARLASVVDGILARVKERAASDYGVEVADLRIRRMAFPEQNLTSVFERMRSERERMAKRFRSEGEEEALKIRADADKERAQLLAEAYRKAATLKGEGEAEAARIYAQATAKDPELYRFLRTLQAYDKMFATKTTVVLPADSELLRLLTEGPKTKGTP